MWHAYLRLRPTWLGQSGVIICLSRQNGVNVERLTTAAARVEHWFPECSDRFVFVRLWLLEGQEEWSPAAAPTVVVRMLEYLYVCRDTFALPSTT